MPRRGAGASDAADPAVRQVGPGRPRTRLRQFTVITALLEWVAPALSVSVNQAV